MGYWVIHSTEHTWVFRWIKIHHNNRFRCVRLNILTSGKATYGDDYSQWQQSQVEHTNEWQGHTLGILPSMTAKWSWIYSRLARPHTRMLTFNDSQVKLNILTSGKATCQNDYSQWQPSQVEYTHKWQCDIPGRLQQMTARSSWIYSPVAMPHTRTITISGSQVKLNKLTSGKAKYQDDYSQW